jgi:hypothetical protein
MGAAVCAWAVKAAADKAMAPSAQARIREDRNFFMGESLEGWIKSAACQCRLLTS